MQNTLSNATLAIPEGTSHPPNSSKTAWTCKQNIQEKRPTSTCTTSSEDGFHWMDAFFKLCWTQTNYMSRSGSDDI